MQETVVKVLDKIVDMIVRIFCILVLLMCLYAMYDTYMVFNKATDNSIQKWKPKESIEEVEQAMPNCIAWITLDDTSIDYPIMQGLTNSDYLNTDPYGNYSLSGSIFLDSRNSSDFTDAYSLIYGHHMEYGVMFGDLDNYRARGYFDQHRTGTLLVGNKKYDVTIFAALDTDADNDKVFEPTETTDVKEFEEWLRNNADIYETPGEGNIIGLSTCSTAGSTARFICFGTFVEANE